ncbi:hypothetical protein [Streptomyces prasinus]
MTGFDEVGALTGLTSLHPDNCTGVEDLMPLSALTPLTCLVLHRCRAVDDVTPLLPLSRLVRLDIDTSRIPSVAGFGAAFSAPKPPGSRGNTRLQDVAQLSGLSRLTALDLGNTGIHELAGLRGISSPTHVTVARKGWSRPERVRRAPGPYSSPRHPTGTRRDSATTSRAGPCGRAGERSTGLP